MCGEGGLYPKGKKLRCRKDESLVEYVGQASETVHIVLAEPLDFLDDRVREVGEIDLLDEEGTNVRMLVRG